MAVWRKFHRAVWIFGQYRLSGYHDWTFEALIVGNNIRMDERILIFSILTLQQGYIEMQDRYIPRYSLPIYSYPVLNRKNGLFYANASTGYQWKWVCIGELGRKPSIASANKECSTILSNRSLGTELINDKNHV